MIYKSLSLSMLIAFGSNVYANDNTGQVSVGVSASSFNQNVIHTHWQAARDCTFTRRLEDGTQEELAKEVAFGSSHVVDLPSGQHYVSAYCYSVDDFGTRLELFNQIDLPVQVIANDTVTADFKVKPTDYKTVTYCPDISLPENFNLIKRVTGEVTTSLDSDNCWTLVSTDLNPNIQVEFDGQLFLIRPSKGMYSYTAYAKQLVELTPISGDVQVIVTLGEESPITTGMELDEMKSNYLVFTRLSETASYTMQAYTDSTMNVVTSINSWVTDTTGTKQALSPSSGVQIQKGPIELEFNQYDLGNYVILRKSGGL